MLIIRQSGSNNKGNQKLISALESVFSSKPILQTQDFNEALITIQKKKVDIVFVEHYPPMLDGLDLINIIRNILHYSTPIVIFTDYGSEEVAIKAMLAGANEYFVKKRINYNEFKDRIKEVFIAFNNVHQIKNNLKKYKKLSLFDPLTKLYNRTGLKKYLAKELSYAIRHDVPLACLFLDLDDFKKINDIEGHNIGDQVLVETAHRLTLCLRNEDIISRLGGDEFVVICIGLSDKMKTASLAKKVIEMLQKPIKTSKGDVFISASMGISYNDHYSTIDSLINSADDALRKSKKVKGVFTFSKR